ncbi:four helix bundle protein [Gracilimonas sp.]|uniref:four helix bundle protein n=1 Tax=Gracilimonas sp. TaxID=1974203 RepID=UPI003752D0CB
MNYGEAQSAESMKDFVHKLQLVLKELRETFVNLRILYRAKLFKNKSTLILALKENNELIAIMVRSIQTSQKRLKN